MKKHLGDMVVLFSDYKDDKEDKEEYKKLHKLYTEALRDHVNPNHILPLITQHLNLYQAVQFTAENFCIKSDILLKKHRDGNHYSLSNGFSACSCIRACYLTASNLFEIRSNGFTKLRK